MLINTIIICILPIKKRCAKKIKNLPKTTQLASKVQMISSRANALNSEISQKVMMPLMKSYMHFSSSFRLPGWLPQRRVRHPWAILPPRDWAESGKPSTFTNAFVEWWASDLRKGNGHSRSMPSQWPRLNKAVWGTRKRNTPNHIWTVIQKCNQVSGVKSTVNVHEN